MVSRNDESQINQEPKDPSTKFVVTPRQSSALIASTLIGAGVLTLPRSASGLTHQSAWIPTLFGGIIVFFIMWAITKLGLRFPGKTFIEYMGTLFGIKSSSHIGRWVTLPISLYYIALWFVIVAFSVRMFAEAIVDAVLPQTPLEVIIGTLLLATFFCLIVELEVIARFNELILPLVLIPVGVITILSFQNVQWVNLLPMFTMDIPTFLKGVMTQLFAYQGFSIMLLFMAFTQRNHNVASTISGVAIPGITYVLITFSAVGVFGFEELQHLTWPTLELVKATNFSQFIFQRIESGFVAVWVVAVYTTVGNLLYAVCFSLAQLLPTKKEDKARKWIGACLLPIVFWVSLIPESEYDVFNWMTYLGYFGLIAFAIPVLLYVLAVVTKKGKGKVRHEKKQRSKKPSPT
ncbi:MAG TPA: endospore germination permease [Bacillales bacterium]|nr:endospore germination permease [Bacillales bacterium]